MLPKASTKEIAAIRRKVTNARKITHPGFHGLRTSTATRTPTHKKTKRQNDTITKRKARFDKN